MKHSRRMIVCLVNKLDITSEIGHVVFIVLFTIYNSHFYLLKLVSFRYRQNAKEMSAQIFMCNCILFLGLNVVTNWKHLGKTNLVLLPKLFFKYHNCFIIVLLIKCILKYFIFKNCRFKNYTVQGYIVNMSLLLSHYPSVYLSIFEKVKSMLHGVFRVLCLKIHSLNLKPELTFQVGLDSKHSRFQSNK